MSEIPERPERSPEPVATGDRRDEVHFERRANQQLRMRATFPVEGPLPRELTPEADATDLPSPDLPTDVAAPKDAPSVWDARPLKG
jgi:hypothetical protein